jgi:hypothetical protein
VIQKLIVRYMLQGPASLAYACQQFFRVTFDGLSRNRGDSALSQQLASCIGECSDDRYIVVALMFRLAVLKNNVHGYDKEASLARLRQ